MTNTIQQAMSRTVPNNLWFSEDEPDPKVLPRLPGWNILVRPVPVRPKSKGGIIIPETVRDEQGYLNTVGRVLVIGDTAYSHKDFEGPWCKVGDYVVYGKHSGEKFVFKKVKLLYLKDTEVKMVVASPEDLL